jgi:CheY-like chemotaxis protein
MVVDDDQDSRSFIVKLCENHGASVVAASRPPSASAVSDSCVPVSDQRHRHAR